MCSYLNSIIRASSRWWKCIKWCFISRMLSHWPDSCCFDKISPKKFRITWIPSNNSEITLWSKIYLFCASMMHQVKTSLGNTCPQLTLGFPGGTVVKRQPVNGGDARDWGLTPGWGRFPGEGNGNPLQYSCLENFMDRGALWAIGYRIAKDQTWLSEWAHTVKY